MQGNGESRARGLSLSRLMTIAVFVLLTMQYNQLFRMTRTTNLIFLDLYDTTSLPSSTESIRSNIDYYDYFINITTPPLPFQQQQQQQQQQSSVVTVDVLSISTLARPEVFETQKSTWGSHRAVRNFIVVTEANDPDPNCASKLNETTLVDQYSNHCRKRSAWPSTNFMTKHFTNNFARRRWLHNMANPGGWLCAQRRTAVGLATLRKRYQDQPVPDMLVMSDDDMYLNMHRLEKDLLAWKNKVTTTTTNTESSMLTGGELTTDADDMEAKVYAGCLIVSIPAPLMQFVLPYGGWGTFFSKAAIERLILPLHCSSTTSKQRSAFEEGACSRLVGGQDLLSESRYFKDGMSLAEVMGASVSNPDPYCAHSDWAIAYFVNFYNISGVRWEGPEAHLGWYPDVPQTRIFPLGIGQKSWVYKTMSDNCAMTGENCQPDSPVCHYVNDLQMKEIDEKVNSFWQER